MMDKSEVETEEEMRKMRSDFKEIRSGEQIEKELQVVEKQRKGASEMADEEKW